MSRRPKLLLALAAALVAAAFVLSIFVGKYPLSPGEIAAILSGGDVEGLGREVFFTLRLPRTVMVLLAGLGLGLAGWVYQLLFQNPLASPDLIGVSSGANLGAACAIVLLGYHSLAVSGFAFLGGLAVLGLALLLVRRAGPVGPTAYILAGILLKAVSEACIMLLKTFADPERELAAIEFWSMGSFGGVTAGKLLPVLPLFFTGFLGLLLLRRQVLLLALEEEECQALGVPVRAVRGAVLALSTLMVTSVIAVTGLITFVGLIAPHVARLLWKRTDFPAGLLSALMGAAILLPADCLARSLASAELPISILTTLVGVPLLLALLLRKRGAAL